MKINLLILSALLVAQNVSAGARLPVEAVLYGSEGEFALIPYGASAAGGSTSGAALDNIILRRYQSAPNAPAVSAVRQLDCMTIGFSGEIRFTVYVLGSVNKDDICRSLSRAEREFRHNPKAARTFSDKDFGFYFRTAKAWYLITFDQRIPLDAERSTDVEADLVPYDPKLEDQWAVSQHGALVHYTKGNVEIYAPGETIQTDDGPYTVKAAMMKDDLLELVTRQSSKKLAETLKKSSSASVAEAMELARKEGAEVTVVKKGEPPGSLAKGSGQVSSSIDLLKSQEWRASESAPVLDEVLPTVDLSKPEGIQRLQNAIEASFPNGDSGRAIPWLRILRGDGDDRRLSLAELQQLASGWLPAPGSWLADRHLVAVELLERGAWLSYAPTGHIRLRFAQGPDFWVQTFASAERLAPWGRGITLSQRLAGNAMRLDSVIVKQGERQAICLNDVASPVNVVCGMPLLPNLAVLSIATRAAEASPAGVDAARQRLARLLVVAASQLSSMRPRDATTWKAQLGALLPDVGAGTGEGRVSAVRFDETARDVRGYRGAAKIFFADGRDVMVFLLDVRRQYGLPNGPSMGWLTFQLGRLMGLAQYPGRTSSVQHADVDGVALSCERTTTVPGTVEVVCGIADPDLPIILATRYSYSGTEEAQPESLRQAAIDRMILARRLMEAATE